MNAYNVKLIQYPNGSAVVRKYSVPIKCKELPNPYEPDVPLDPFTYKPYTVVDKFEIKEKVISKKDIIQNQYRSANRTKQKIFDYARCANWEYFVTFTFSPEKIDRYDFDACSKAIRKWLNNQRRNAPNLLYLIVPEQHQDGAWHFHGVLANVGNMKFIDSGKKQKGRIVYNMSAWSAGFSTATAVTSIDGVSKYIGKYITKSLCDQTKGKHRYYVSDGIELPETSTFFIDGVRQLTPEEQEVYNSLLPDPCDTFGDPHAQERFDFLQSIFAPEEYEQFCNFLITLADSLGLVITNVSSPRHDGAFIDVDYYDLQKGASV